MANAFDHSRTTLGCLLLAVGVWAGCAGTPPGSVTSQAEGAPSNTVQSKLWGRDAEFWLVGGRLPDFSYAGYRNGERPIPDLPAVTNVVAYGARGDDDRDDTAAFKAAIAATPSGAVWVPAGRYVISDVLAIDRSGVVLRGAGAEATTLYFPKPLDAIKPRSQKTASGRPVSGYSWSGGFVKVEGKLMGRALTVVNALASRGDDVITVGNTKGLVPGRLIELQVSDRGDNSLAQHLYSADAGDVSRLDGKTTTSFVTRIVRVEGNTVVLERRLRFDLRPEWRPVVKSFEPTVEDSGVEDLTFEFPATPYEGHFEERGYNPIAFESVAHCWARRVKIVNADNGPLVGGVFNTVSDLVVLSRRAPDAGGNHGHHGIYLKGVGDHLLTRFEFQTRFVHDITVSSAGGVVVSNGRGEDLALDGHKRAAYEVLFTALDLGRGTRPWRSGGGDGLGKHHGARTTFWNVTAAGPLPEPPAAYGPWSMNLVGVDLGRPGVTDPAGLWRELTSGQVVDPIDLHAAQLARRLQHGREMGGQ